MSARISYTDAYRFQLTEDYVVRLCEVRPDRHISTRWLDLSIRGNLWIRTGYAWNGPSGPAIATKSFMRGSLVHDALYQLERVGLLSTGQRDAVDRELMTLCREDGMWAPRRWWIYLALRRFGSTGSARVVRTAP